MAKLKINPKFDVGEKFWAIHGLGVACFDVYRIKVLFDGKHSKVSYIASNNDLTEFFECRMFKTKQELIESL